MKNPLVKALVVAGAIGIFGVAPMPTEARLAALHWGWMVGPSTSYRDREGWYQSILWEIQGDWEDTCAATRGFENRLPDRCENNSFREYGYWHVPWTNLFEVPNNALRWGWMGDGGNSHGAEVKLGARGKIVLRNILWNIGWNDDWEDTCIATRGYRDKKPDRCVNDGFHIWGEWDVDCGLCNNWFARERRWHRWAPAVTASQHKKGSVKRRAR
jgi:hypothetical protein